MPVWQQVTGTQWSYAPPEGGTILRTIIYNPMHGTDLPGPKYVVTGPGHEVSVHPTLSEAKEAAEATL